MAKQSRKELELVEEDKPITPIPRSDGQGGSELDEYINLGEKPKENEEDEVLDELLEEVEEETDSAPLPRIDRDEKMEKEIENEKSVPVEKLLDDVADVSQSLDPVRMYLRDIGKHPLLTAEQEMDFAQKILDGVQAQEKIDSIQDWIAAEEELADATDPEIRAELEETIESGKQLFKDLTKKGAQFENDTTEDVTDQLGLTVLRGEEAHRQLAQSNLRLVVSVAKRYIGRGLNFLDLIQEGNLGLLRAVDKFDHTLGFKFSTYATWWIRQAISRAIADQARTIRIPVHMVETINRQVRTQRRLQQELGRDPTNEEIALEMEFVDEEDTTQIRRAMADEQLEMLEPDVLRRLERAATKVGKIQRLSQEPLSLQAPVGPEESSSLADFIPDRNDPGPADTASRHLLKEQMEEILDQLNERERKVLVMRFGLDDGINRTLEDVGREFNVTRERVRQIEAKALRKLRHPLRSRKLRDYLGE